jgi:hypothetical protein
MNTTIRTALSIAMLAVFGILAAATASRDDRGSSSSTGGPAASEPKTYTYIDEKCGELAEKFGTQSKLSDLQKEELWKNYKGKAFKWNLQVTEVSSDAFGGYTVQFKCAHNSPSLIQDIQLKYRDDHKDVVMKMNKDGFYSVGGVLKRSSSLLGMSGDAIVQ